MEANTVTLNNSNATVEKKMRKPSLPAKFNKFIQFGYFFLKQYNAMDGVTPIDENSFLDKLHLFDTVDNQLAFVQAFFDDAKNINKTIRKVIQAKLKADKKAAAPPKVKAPRVKKTKTNKKTKTETETETETDTHATEPTLDVTAQTTTDSTEPTTTTTKTKTSRRKTKVAVVPDVQDELISQLTSLANNTTTNTDSLVSSDKPKVEKKTKAEKKPKAEKKTKIQKNTNLESTLNLSNDNNNNNNNDNDNDNDNDILTSPIIIDGKQFLIDDSNNVYNFDDHILIGKLINNLFNPL